MASNRAKFSQQGLNPLARIDQAALSPVARRQMVIVAAIGAFTQNTTTKFSRGPLGCAATLKAAYASCRTAPAGGTLSVRVVAYDASADAEINLTNTLDPEALTVREATAFALATTNTALSPEDTIEVHSVADNNAVGTAIVDGFVTLVFERTEDSVISD
jgi:hypothetical protein